MLMNNYELLKRRLQAHKYLLPYSALFSEGLGGEKRAKELAPYFAKISLSAAVDSIWYNQGYLPPKSRGSPIDGPNVQFLFFSFDPHSCYNVE
jgi:hypothetical protein